MCYVCCVVLCCCCRLLSSTTSYAINHHRCLLLLALVGTSTFVLAIHCHCHISTITTTTTIFPTPPCPPAQSRLPPTAAAAAFSNPLACDAMQCFLRTSNQLLILLLFCVMFMCQWYCNPPAGAAAAAGLWFDWLLLCFCGTGSK
jgi:hypothetical protein